MGSNPSHFKAAGENAPVENVRWTEAVEYCRKLTERERAAGGLPAGFEYRLPSEAQWEYACRAGTTGPYAGDLAAMGWYEDNSGSKTHARSQKRANGWGLYDMHGNVLEWCSDWFGDYPSGSVTDPTGPSSGTDRVLRGGGCVLSAQGARSAARYHVSPGNSNDLLGFRVALSSVR